MADLLSNARTVPIPGAFLTIADVRPDLRAGDRWRVATTPSCDLYVLAGSLADGTPAAYVGITSVLEGTRPAVSLRRWAIQTGRLVPTRVGLIGLSAEPDRDELELLEKRVVRGLNARGVVALNTITGAKQASSRLGSRASAIAARGDAFAAQVHRLVMNDVSASLTIPATTASETAVRLVLHHGAPMGRDQILSALTQVSPRRGRTPWASVRRDLSVLERTTAGEPRVQVLHKGRHAFIYPANLTPEEAVAMLESA